MLETLQVDEKKVFLPTREEMINMNFKACRKIDVNFTEVSKQHFITNKHYGSEDYLVNDKLFDLVGNEMKYCNQEVNSIKRNETKKTSREKVVVIEVTEFDDFAEDQNETDEPEPSETNSPKVKAVDDMPLEKTGSEKPCHFSR